MSTNIQLVSLRCSKCSQPLSADANGIFLYCGACGAGFEILNHQELVELPVYFARKGNKNQEFAAFWAFDATLELTKRDAKGGFFSNPKGLAQLFEERRGLRFYVAAFQKDLDSKEPVALELTYEQPELEYLHAQKKFPPVEISQEDAKKIADYLLITSEIEQKDTLKALEYRLTLQNPMLIAIAL
jgi:hypothetical protein